MGGYLGYEVYTLDPKNPNPWVWGQGEGEEGGRGLHIAMHVCIFAPLPAHARAHFTLGAVLSRRGGEGKGKGVGRGEGRRGWGEGR